MARRTNKRALQIPRGRVALVPRSLVPVIGLVQVGSQPMADRYTYLPIVGLFIVIVWGLSDLLQRVPGDGDLLAGGATLALAVSVVLARQQVAIWENSVDLWQHTLRVTSNNYRAHNNLAQALSAMGRSEEASSHYQAALRINPDSVEAHSGIGAVLGQAGRQEDAIAHYRHALRVSPADAIARANLGAALAEQGKVGEAEAHLRAALETAPDLPLALGNLGVALARQGRTSEALGLFARVVDLQPTDGAAHRHLASALALEGRTDDAIVQFETALRLDPADAPSRNGLGEALEAAGKLEAAALEYEKAVQVESVTRGSQGQPRERTRCVSDDWTRPSCTSAKRSAFDLRIPTSRYDLAVVLWRKGHGRRVAAAARGGRSSGSCSRTRAPDADGSEAASCQFQAARVGTMIAGKKVVVVMPAYNAERTLERTWREVVEFDFVDLVIVVDDASQDRTLSLARHLPKVVAQSHPSEPRLRSQSEDVLSARARPRRRHRRDDPPGLPGTRRSCFLRWSISWPAASTRACSARASSAGRRSKAACRSGATWRTGR